MLNQEIQHQVIVIGTGIAGISCAQQLQANGIDVLLLEARDRIGGRIHSQLYGEDILDLGASWIHGIEKNPLWQLSQEQHIATTIYNYQQHQFHHSDGQPFNTLQQQYFEAYIQSVEQQLLSSQQSTALQAVQDILDHLQVSDEVCAEFSQDSVSIKNLLMNYFKRIANDPYACELEQLTARYAIHEGYFAGDEVIFKQGYAQLINALAQDLNIRLNSTVLELQQRPEMVQLRDQHGQLYYAHQVVLAVPLGVLQHQLIQISPSLPALYWESIQQMGFGSFNKFYFELEQPLFAADSLQNSYFFQHDQVWFEVLDLSKVYAKPLYVMLFGGNQSAWIDQVSDQEVWTFVRYHLSPSLPSLPHEAKAVYVTRWGVDPFSLGAFSYPHTEHHQRYIETLQHPVQQQLFFAGEHCHLEYPATVHGAYLSGQDTAAAIIEQLKNAVL